MNIRDQNLGTNVPIYAGKEGRMMVNPAIDGDQFKLFIPPIAAGANKVYFDLFNGSTDKVLQVSTLIPVIHGDVAVTGTLAVRLNLTRTTAVGTGGTAATIDGTDLTAATISKLDPRQPALPSTITARNAPSGGATAGAIIAVNSVFTEETNVATYNRQCMCDLGNQGKPIVVFIPPGTGIRVVQGTVASVGNIGFDVWFSVRNV